MDNPGLTQQIKGILICGAGLLVAIFLGTQIGAENYGELVLGSAILILAAISFFSGRFFWVLTIGSSFLGGTFPVLRGQFTLFQILMAIGVAKFFLGDVVLRRTRLRLGTQMDRLLIAGFIGVLTYHGVQDRFGMRFLGSNVWGGRLYVNVYVGLVAYFVIQSIPIKARVWSKLPYVVLAATGFDAAIALITTIWPKSIYTIYPFYSAVSTAGVEEVLTGRSLEAARLSAVGNFGIAIVILVLATTSVRNLFHPSYLRQLVTLVAGGLAVLGSGFRSAVLSTLIAGTLATIRDLKMATLFVLPLVAVFLFSLSIINSEVFALPRQIQRSLAFLPGHWDVEAAQDAAASNDFRHRVWGLWKHDYFPVHPLIGRGFGFRSQWAEKSVSQQGAYEVQQMVETGNIHNGLYSATDALGLIGTTCFVLWALRILRRTFRVPLPEGDRGANALRFLALYLAASIIFYWVGASSLGGFLPQLFAMVAVFDKLQREIFSEKRAGKSPVSEQPAQIDERLVTA